MKPVFIVPKCNAIIFTRNIDFVELLSTNHVNISELLIIPPNDKGINLLDAMGEGSFDRRVIGAAYPELIDHKMFNQKQTKYIDGTNTYVNLVLDNVSATATLKIFDLLEVQNNSSASHIYNIVCLDNQLDFIIYIVERLNLKKLNVVFKTIAPGQTSFY